jgi:hypothetical protein
VLLHLGLLLSRERQGDEKRKGRDEGTEGHWRSHFDWRARAHPG